MSAGYCLLKLIATIYRYLCMCIYTFVAYCIRVSAQVSEIYLELLMGFCGWQLWEIDCYYNFDKIILWCNVFP